MGLIGSSNAQITKGGAVMVSSMVIIRADKKREGESQISVCVSHACWVSYRRCWKGQVRTQISPPDSALFSQLPQQLSYICFSFTLSVSLHLSVSLLIPGPEVQLHWYRMMGCRAKEHSWSGFVWDRVVMPQWSTGFMVCLAQGSH